MMTGSRRSEGRRLLSLLSSAVVKKAPDDLALFLPLGQGPEPNGVRGGLRDAGNSFISEVEQLAARETKLEDPGFKSRHRRVPVLDDARDFGHDKGLRVILVDPLDPLFRPVRSKV
jgi:hypothetical protein